MFVLLFFEIYKGLFSVDNICIENIKTLYNGALYL